MILDWKELFGIAASLVVAVSLMMKSLKRLRIINAAGALAFSLYGLLIGSLSVTVLNAFIVGIDLWYLLKMRLSRDAFGLLEVDPASSAYFRHFIEFYGRDIARFQPEFLDPSSRGGAAGEAPRKAEFVLRDMVPVSLIVYRPRPEGGVEIELDYAIPSHRDFKSAEYYFGKVTERIAAGAAAEGGATAAARPDGLAAAATALFARASVPAHAAYLRRLGFAPTGARFGAAEEYRKG